MIKSKACVFCGSNTIENTEPSGEIYERPLIDKIMDDEILCFADFDRDEYGKILHPYQIHFVLNGGNAWMGM
jgi:hypothetical protein